jgi:predicted dehydrogenase
MRPRVGFLGVGWIGRHRLEAVVRSGTVEVVGVADTLSANAAAAAQLASCAPVGSLHQLLDLQPNGIVIATPSALHAEQASAALERGIAVFCQKPLARTAAETAQVVELARQADRLLGVDMSYRHAEAARRVRDLVRSGELGSIYAADLVFHNAYGPDKAWFHDPTLSGGGCVIDLGIHLVDLLLWTLEPSVVSRVSSRLFAKGQLLPPSPPSVEDFAWAELQLENGTATRLACSWNLSAGRDAVIEVSFFGTRGTARLSNVNGSFYDFTAERFQGTNRECICAPPDEWGGRAIVDWARRLAEDSGFDSSADQLIAVADVIDGIYGREGTSVEIGTAPEIVVEVPAGLL